MLNASSLFTPNGANARIHTNWYVPIYPGEDGINIPKFSIIVKKIGADKPSCKPKDLITKWTFKKLIIQIIKDWLAIIARSSFFFNIFNPELKLFSISFILLISFSDIGKMKKSNNLMALSLLFVNR